MIDRRALMQMLGGLSLAATPVFARSGLDFGDPEDFLTAATKMRGSTDDRLVMGWVIGTRYAVIDHAAIPIMGILAATFSQYRRISPDAYDVTALEVAYFTDFESRKLLESWTNPFTNKTVEVPMVRMGPSKSTLTAKGLTVNRPSGEAVGMELQHRFRPAVVNGDSVWISEEIKVRGSHPDAREKPFVYNEMTTYQARRSELENENLATVPTQVQFHGLVTYRPWMGFGDMAGHTTAHGAGTRVARAEDLPPYYLELTERFHPDVLDDPLGALQGDSE